MRGRAGRFVPGVLLALGLLAVRPAPLGAGTPAIAILKSGPLAPYEAVARSFHAAWTGEVLDLTLEGQDPDALAGRLQSSPLDVIVAVGLRAATFARDRLPRVPMVFCAVPNYEVHDLSGTWITGIGFDVPERAALRALKDAVPEATRVGVLVGAEETPFLRSARVAAAANGLTLVEALVANRAALAPAARGPRPSNSCSSCRCASASPCWCSRNRWCARARCCRSPPTTSGSGCTPPSRCAGCSPGNAPATSRSPRSSARGWW